MRSLAHRLLTLVGWEFRGDLPALDKMIVVGAPHTSNWDFVVFLAALRHFGVSVGFLGKHTLFRPPLGTLFRSLGGIPVDRERPGGMVAEVTERFHAADRLVLVLAPEGTRKKTLFWHSGFLEIAHATGVPVVLAGIDYPSRTATIGPVLTHEGDVERFMSEARRFYEPMVGRHPRNQGRVRLRSESQPLR